MFIFLNKLFVFCIYSLTISLFIILPLLLSIAFFTIAERKIMASIQRRRGPNVVGFWGLLQPFADGLKALIKELIIPYQTNRFLFLLAPCLTFILSLINWALIPFTSIDVLADLNYGLLYLYALSSLSVYGIILSGWVSQSKYPFLGSIRSAAQMISYEVSIGLIFVILTLCTHSLNLIEVVWMQEQTMNFIWLLFPIAGIFMISMLAETNRAPFDLPEAEAELVAGYNLEYSSIIFAFFFIGEYGNIFMMSTLFSILFLGGWTGLLFLSEALCLQLKSILVCFIFILVRAALPRYRYDQLMDICWQLFLPFNLIYLLMLAVLFIRSNVETSIVKVSTQLNAYLPGFALIV
jgi:NADH-quinone oxidoreductase subunit H